MEALDAQLEACLRVIIPPVDAPPPPPLAESAAGVGARPAAAAAAALRDGVDAFLRTAEGIGRELSSVRERRDNSEALRLQKAIDSVRAEDAAVSGALSVAAEALARWLDALDVVHGATTQLLVDGVERRPGPHRAVAGSDAMDGLELATAAAAGSAAS